MLKLKITEGREATRVGSPPTALGEMYAGMRPPLLPRTPQKDARQTHDPTKVRVPTRISRRIVAAKNNPRSGFRLKKAATKMMKIQQVKAVAGNIAKTEAKKPISTARLKPINSTQKKLPLVVRFEGHSRPPAKPIFAANANTLESWKLLKAARSKAGVSKGSQTSLQSLIDSGANSPRGGFRRQTADPTFARKNSPETIPSDRAKSTAMVLSLQPSAPKQPRPKSKRSYSRPGSALQTALGQTKNRPIQISMMSPVRSNKSFVDLATQLSISSKININTISTKSFASDGFASSPKVKANSQMEYEREVTVGVLDLINEETIEELRMAFESHSCKARLLRNDFIHILTSVLQGTQDSQFAVRMNQLFNAIDVNGNGTISWDDFTDFIVQSAYDMGKLHETGLDKYHHLRSVDIAEKIEKLYYFDNGTSDWAIFVVLKADKNAFKIWIHEFDQSKGREITMENGQPLSADMLKEGINNSLAISTIDCTIVLYDVAPLAGSIHLKRKLVAKEIQTCVRFSKVYQLGSTETRPAFLFSGGLSGRVLKWDYVNAVLISMLDGHEDSVSAMIEISGDENIATGSYDGKIRMWDLDTGRGQRCYNAHRKGVLALAYSVKHCLLISSGFESDVKVWNPLIGGQLICKLQGHTSSLIGVAVGENSPEVVSLSEDGILKVWDVRNLTQAQTIKIQIAENEVKDLCYSERQGYSKLIVLQGRKLEFFDNQTVDNVKDVKGKTHASAVLYHADSHCFVTVAGRDVSLYSAANGCLLRNHTDLAPENEDISAICFDVTERRIVLGFSKGGLAVHDLISGNFSEGLEHHTSEVIALKMHLEHDGNDAPYIDDSLEKQQESFVISCSRSGSIRIHQLGRRKHSIRYIVEHSTGLERLTKASLKTAMETPTAVEQEIATSPHFPHEHDFEDFHNNQIQPTVDKQEIYTSRISFESEKSRTLSASKRRLSLETNLVQRQMNQSGDSKSEEQVDVSLLAYSQQLQFIATSTYQGTIFIWDSKKIREVTPLATLECHLYQISSLCFMEPLPALASSDMEGRVIISSLPPSEAPFQVIYEFTNFLEDSDADSVTMDIGTEKSQSCAINSMSWYTDPTNAILVSGDDDGYITIWDMLPLVESKIFKKHLNNSMAKTKSTLSSLPISRRGSFESFSRRFGHKQSSSVFVTAVDPSVHSDQKVFILNQWQGHTVGICSIQILCEKDLYVKMPPMNMKSTNRLDPAEEVDEGEPNHCFLLTSCFDSSIKLWNVEGKFIGMLQQKTVQSSIGTDLFWCLHIVECDYGLFDNETVEEMTKMLTTLQEKKESEKTAISHTANMKIKALFRLQNDENQKLI